MPSASAPSGFTLRATNSEALRTGTYFYGLRPTQTTFMPGNPSTLCVGAPVQRTQLSNTFGVANCEGVLTLDWNAWRASNPGALGSPFTAGLAVFAQGWMRDSSLVGHSVLTDAITFVLCP